MQRIGDAEKSEHMEMRRKLTKKGRNGRKGGGDAFRDHKCCFVFLLCFLVSLSPLPFSFP